MARERELGDGVEWSLLTIIPRRRKDLGGSGEGYL